LHYQPAARRQRKLGHNGRRLLPVDCQVNSTADTKNKGIKRPRKLYRRLTEGPQESGPLLRQKRSQIPGKKQKLRLFSTVFTKNTSVWHATTVIIIIIIIFYFF